MASASPWDIGAPSPVPIRASGSSVRSSSSRYGGRSNQFADSREGDLTNEVCILDICCQIDLNLCFVFRVLTSSCQAFLKNVDKNYSSLALNKLFGFNSTCVICCHVF